jgi:hypothetical protein
MEISIKIDGGEAQLAGGQAGPGPRSAAQAVAQQAAEGTGPPPEVAAAAAAVGAIDAGRAQIPPGQTGEPLDNVAASTQAQMSDAGQEAALAAGAAPEYAQETSETVDAEGEEEG